MSTSQSPEGYGKARLMEFTGGLCRQFPRTIGRVVMGDQQTIRPLHVVRSDPGEYHTFKDSGRGHWPARYSHGVVLGVAQRGMSAEQLWSMYDSEDPRQAAAAFVVGETVLAMPISPEATIPRPYDTEGLVLKALFRVGDGDLTASLGTLNMEQAVFTPAQTVEILSFPLPMDEVRRDFPDIQRV